MISSQTDLENSKDDDFGEFASFRSLSTSIAVAPLSNTDQLLSGGTSALNNEDVGGLSVAQQNFPPISTEPILKPSSGGDKYSALRDAFSMGSIIKNDSMASIEKFNSLDPSINCDESLLTSENQSSFPQKSVLDTSPCNTNEFTDKTTFAGQKLLSSFTEGISPNLSLQIAPIAQTILTSNDDDFGEFIAVAKGTTSAATPRPNSQSVSSKTTPTRKVNVTKIQHERSDTFFMPQNMTPNRTNKTVLPVWHDSEPPPLTDESQDALDIISEPSVEKGALDGDFFAGFEDDVSSESAYVEVCTSILDEDQYFTGLQNENNESKCIEQLDKLQTPSIPRENSISSLNLRVESSSPDDEKIHEVMEIKNVDFLNDTPNRYGSVYEFMRESDNHTLFNSSEDTDGLESPFKEWLASFKQIYLLVSQASDAFSYIPNDAILEEVLQTDKGSNYIKNIVEIYRVYKRIHLSHEKLLENRKNVNQDKYARAEESDEIQKIGDKIEQSWKQLTINLNGRSIVPGKSVFNFQPCLVKQLENSYENNSSNNDRQESLLDSCGLCLLSVSRSTVKSEDAQHGIVMDSILTHNNRRYHSTCANFWVNRVEVALPALNLYF